MGSKSSSVFPGVQSTHAFCVRTSMLKLNCLPASQSVQLPNVWSTSVYLPSTHSEHGVVESRSRSVLPGVQSTHASCVRTSSVKLYSVPCAHGKHGPTLRARSIQVPSPHSLQGVSADESWSMRPGWQSRHAACVLMLAERSYSVPVTHASHETVVRGWSV